MRAKFETAKPDEIELSLTMTMPIKDWQELKGQLQDNRPSFELGQAITEMIIEASSTFHMKETKQ